MAFTVNYALVLQYLGVKSLRKKKVLTPVAFGSMGYISAFKIKLE